MAGGGDGNFLMRIPGHLPTYGNIGYRKAMVVVLPGRFRDKMAYERLRKEAQSAKYEAVREAGF